VVAAERQHVALLLEAEVLEVVVEKEITTTPQVLQDLELQVKEMMVD
jgi:hypothetical protein